MSTFKSISVVKFPPAPVAATMRDRLAELVPLLDDIEQIAVVERSTTSDGTVTLVNRWTTGIHLPRVLNALVPTEAISWTDHAVWSASGLECAWHIETQLPGLSRCNGSTRYEPAI